jgi:hypothetical protein
MKRTAAIAIAFAMFALPAPVLAQGDPFGPLAPSAPPEPAPPPPQPAPAQEDDDDSLGLAASLGLALLAALAIGAVFVAIVREGRRMDRRKASRGRAAKRGARPANPRRFGSASSRSPAAARQGGGDGKRPPPPPRKRRPKSKRR